LIGAVIKAKMQTASTPEVSSRSGNYGIAVLGVVFLSKAIVALISNYCHSFLRPPAVTAVLELTVSYWNRDCLFQ
jgi:hypothetical protein